MISTLVTGVGSLLGQGILKSLKRSSLACRITGTDYFPTAVGLYWVDHGYILPDILKPDITEEYWLEELIKVIRSENIEIVLVGLDFEVPLISGNKDMIEAETDVFIVVSAPEIVKIGDDKWETVSYLNENGFDYPASSLPENLDKFLRDNQFPLIVKPRFGHTSKNVFKVENQMDLEKAIGKCDSPIIQEYLEDEDREYTCGSTFIDDTVLTSICLRRTLKDGNTQLAFSEKTEELDAFIVEVTKCIKPYGPINFQLRLTDRGPMIFEINPRFSGTTPIRTLFGVNEVEAVINAILTGNPKFDYNQKDGVVIRHLENQYVTWDQFRNFT